MLFFIGSSSQVSCNSQCHYIIRYCFKVLFNDLLSVCCPFISWMSIWSVYRNTLIIIFSFYSLGTFPCKRNKVFILSYYPMFLVSLIPVVSFGQTSVLSGLFCKISHGPSESRALFTGHSSCGAPVVFLHISHIQCSALVSQPPPNQLCSLVIQAVRFPITLPIFF